MPGLRPSPGQGGVVPGQHGKYEERTDRLHLALEPVTVLSLLSAPVYDTGAISDDRPVSASQAIGDASFTLPPPKQLRIIKPRGGS